MYIYTYIITDYICLLITQLYTWLLMYSVIMVDLEMDVYSVGRWYAINFFLSTSVLLYISTHLLDYAYV